MSTMMAFHLTLLLMIQDLQVESSDPPKETHVVMNPSGVIMEGDSVNLTCSSESNPPVQNYSWFKVNETSPVGSGQTYSITNINSSHSGWFYCEAQNEVGFQRSAAVSVIVNHSPDYKLLFGIAGACAGFIIITTIITLIMYIKRRQMITRKRSAVNEYETVHYKSPEDTYTAQSCTFVQENLSADFRTTGEEEDLCSDEEESNGSIKKEDNALDEEEADVPDKQEDDRKVSDEEEADVPDKQEDDRKVSDEEEADVPDKQEDVKKVSDEEEADVPDKQEADNVFDKEKKNTRKPIVQLASANMLDIIKVIDMFDRPGIANTEGKYANGGTYKTGLIDKPMERVPKIGVYAEAGVGRAHAEFSLFEAEAKGPNASAGAEASVVNVVAMARAEVGSASAKAGPIGLKLGLGVDTGASIGLNGLEVKVLGTGVSIGPKTSVSLFNSEVSCSIM